MGTKNIIFLVVTLISFIAFGYSFKRVISIIKSGKGDEEYRLDKIPVRIWNVLAIAFGQKKLLRDKVPGYIHFIIFWGFIILTLGTVETIINGIFPSFSYSKIIGKNFYSILTFLQELFGVLVILAVLSALYRRYIIKPKRLQVELKHQIDATIILLLILFLMIAMFAMKWKYEIFWWVHILIIYIFLNYLPYSKHMHVITSIPNVFLSSLRPKGAILPINLEDEKRETFGASDIEELSWKQLLDGYTCTECGRCTENCPANITGKPLSPRKIMVDIRDRLKEKSKLKEKSDDKKLIENYITPEEIWSCTTCRACENECPVMIEHLSSIISLRRYLTLMEGQISPEATRTLNNIKNNYTPWAISYTTRGDWAKDLGVKTLAEDKDIEILFWVGCAGSFDDRNIKVSKAFVKILQKAGIKFGILGSEEKCTGDTPRRLGDEYLFQTLANDNIETLNKYGVKKIVTACPHCFNTLKNEYPQFGGNYEVIHHSEYIYQLITKGKIKLSKKEDKEFVYHDSCYLGRYNEIYEAPRKVIEFASSKKLLEMKRSRDKNLCCGGGGGRMWLEETLGKRINEERVEEALSLNPSIIGTACPFCLTMLFDAIKIKGKDEQVQVLDIAEIVSNLIE